MKTTFRRAATLLTLTLSLAAARGAHATSLGPLDPDGVSHARVVVPMVLPVAGRVSWCDTFLASRGGGRRRHLGQDLMGPKMRPLLAAFDGVAYPSPSRAGGHNILRIVGDCGWTAVYMHINNDTPGTDDGQGTAQYAFAPGITSGTRVRAGQHVAYLGDSGNAENTPPHLHFELHESASYAVVNAAPSLAAATKLDQPCDGVPLETAGPEETNEPEPRDDAAGRGEILLEGVVREVEQGGRQLQMEVDAVAEPDGARTALAPARAKVVRIECNTRVRLASEPERVLLPMGLQRAWRVRVIGKNLGVGSQLPARTVVVLDGAAPSGTLVAAGR